MPDNADLELVGRDPALPGLRDVLAPTRESAWWARTCAAAPGDPVVAYVKYKPGQSCLAGVVVGGTSRYIVKAWRPTDPALHGHQDAIADAEQAITVTAFPGDDKVRGSRWLLDRASRDRAHEQLNLPHPDECSVEILGWKPERRAVYRVSTGTGPVALVKCHTTSGAQQARAASLALGPLPFPSPVLRGESQRRGAMSYHWLAGESLTHASATAGQFAEAGRLLAALHRAHVPSLTAQPPGRAERLRASIATLAVILPAAHGPAVRALDEIEHLSHHGGPTVPIHGDFYIKQLIATPQGLACLDFDEAAMGDAFDDLAVFLAHVERDVAREVISSARGQEIREAFLDGYGVAHDAVRSAVAEQLLGLVQHPFRHRAPNWPRDTMALIDRAHHLLARQRAPLSTAVGADRALQAVAPLLDPSRATAAVRSGLPGYPGAEVSGVCVERHKVGRRTLLSLRVHPTPGAPPERWLVKGRARGTDHRSAEMQRALWDAGLHRDSSHGVSVPEPLGVLDAHQAVVQRWVEGAGVATLLQGGMDPAKVGQRVAQALRVLHAAPVRATRRWSVDDELGMLDGRLTTLATARPSLAPAVGHLWRRLVELAAPLRTRGTATLVHRDFYHDQLLLDGARTWLLDLDCCAMGDPAIDVGNFVAHLIESAWRDALPPQVVDQVIVALLDDYTSTAGDGTHDAVGRWTALSLARLVEIALHHDARRHWVPELLDRVRQWLPPRARGAIRTPPSLRSLEAAS